MIRCAVAAVLFALTGPPAGAEMLPGPYQATGLRVIDGDTIEARVRIWLGQEVVTTIRLAGIDAAELHAACPWARAAAEAARRFLADRLAGRAIALTDIAQDKYGGRIVARVSADGADLGAALLAIGLARPYQDRRPDWCGGQS